MRSARDSKSKSAFNSPGIVGSEAQYNVAVVWHSDCVFEWRSFELPIQQAASVQVEGVLQADLLDCCVGRAAHADDVERVTVEMEWMAEVILLDFIDKDDLDDGVQWDVDLVRAHAVGSAVSGSVVAVAELIRVDVVVLRENRCGRGNVGNLVDKAD